MTLIIFLVLNQFLMRALYITLIALMASIVSEGQHHTETLSPAEHLLAINIQWDGKTISEKVNISFSSDTERIAYHLGQVIERLGTETIQDPQIAARRSALLRSLKEYQLAARFPINTKHSVRSPYFIDDFGTACAVGHLMIESDHEELALQIKEDHNFDYIADIQTEGIGEWASAYGFTLDELALIQPAYPPGNQLTAIGDGVNGPIECMISMPDGRLYISGEFDELDGSIPCSSGLGYYQDGSYHCISDGPTGTIKNMVQSIGPELIMVGELYSNGVQYAAATHLDGVWEYYTIPDRPGAIGKAISRNYGEYSRYVIGIDPQDGSNNNEVWRYDEGLDSWHQVITSSGEINCMSNPYYNYVAGGFESYVDHLSDDAVVMCDGLVKLDLQSFSPDEATPFVSQYLPDTIHSIFLANDIVYLTGTCDDIYPNTYLTRLQNGVLQPLIYHEEYWGQQNLGFYDVRSAGGNELYVAGDFNMDGGFYFGNNIGVYNLLFGSLSSFALLDGAVRRVATYNDEVYLAGDFTNNVGVPMPYLAKIGLSTSLIEHDQLSMTLSPNPAQDYIDIRFDELVTNIKSLQIRSLDGKEQKVSSTFSDQGIHIDISTLTDGVYLYTLNLENGTASGRFVKE